MGNCPSPTLAEEISDEEVERCESGSCTSIQPVTERSHTSYKEKDVFISDVQVWKNGIIPYELNHCLDFNKDRIKQAMRTIEKYSRMRFVEKCHQKTYLEITKANGCYFRKGVGFGQPRVSLGIGCEEFGTVLHELMHAIGFPHEQKRPDRDDYIIIHRENIQRGQESQFSKLKEHEYFWSKFPFDYDSIMLYNSYAFSKNGLKTIEAVNGKQLPRKTNLSEIDKKKLRSL